MTDLLAAGDFSVDLDARTVRGLLLPFGEASRLSANGVPPITFAANTIKVPRDVSVISANREHNRHDPVGRATAIEPTPAGLVATFAVAHTDEGDDFLAQYKAGTKRKLSAEVADIVRSGSNAVSARLTGAAFVTEGAFASAALFALGDVTETTDTEGAQVAPLAVPESGTVAIVAESVPERIEVTTADDETPITFTPDTETEAADVATAAAPTNLDASTVEPTKAVSVFEAIQAASKGDDTLLAALADIKTSGTGALPSAGVIQPAWLGEVWAEKTYERKFWSLVKNGNLTNMDEKGFILDAAEPLVQPYAGNKANVPTGNGTTSLVSSEFQRWAVAVDIAREFFDIPGNNEVIEAFIKRFFSDYAKVTDKWALQKFYAAAGTAIPVASGQHVEYNDSITKLITAVDSLDDTDVEPSFVIVAPDVFKELRFTPKDKVPEYITFSANRQDGTADGVQVLRDKFGVLAAGQVLVGAHDAAHLNELPGASPLTVDAIDIARGGIDKAVHGYSQSLIEYADGFQLFGNAA